MRISHVLADKLEMAERLKQIRKGSGLTQERLAEILDISLSAYKKIESGENQISIEGLRRLGKEMDVSSDFVIFGKNETLDEAWKTIVNCTESDKMRLMLRLVMYFQKTKEVRYCVREEQTGYDAEITNVLKEMDIRESDGWTSNNNS